MTAGIRAVIGGAASRVQDYDASLNGSIGTTFAGTGTPDNTWRRYGVARLRGGTRVAQTLFDGTNWLLQVGTLSSATITWGATETLSDISTVANACAQPVVFSDTLVGVIYRDSEGTPQIQATTYSVATNTLTPDQTLNLAQAPALTVVGVSVDRVSATRAIVFYPNSSGYPTVIGINASAGNLTKDASAAVIESNGMGDESVAIRSIGGGGLVADYNKSNALYGSVITDSGSGTSAGSPAQKTATTVSAPWLCAGDGGGIGGCSRTATGGLWPFRSSSGAIDDEFTNTSTSAQLWPIGRPLGQGVYNGADLAGAWLGDVDGDGYLWAAQPCTPAAQAGKIHLLFMGFNGAAGTPEDSMRQVLKLATSSATDMVAGSMRVIDIDATTMWLSYIEATNADYKYLIVKL